MTNIQAIDLLKDLEQSLDDYCELNDEGKTAFRMAITALELFGISEQLPSAQPEQRWIPCSERLPNTNGIYIVTRRISDGFEYRNITDACYFDGSNTWHDDTRVNHGRKYLADVLAWMPLPEPWKGEKDE